jgi:hypothetical protein
VSLWPFEEEPKLSEDAQKRIGEVDRRARIKLREKCRRIVREAKGRTVEVEDLVPAFEKYTKKVFEALAQECLDEFPNEPEEYGDVLRYVVIRQVVDRVTPELEARSEGDYEDPEEEEYREMIRRETGDELTVWRVFGNSTWPTSAVSFGPPLEAPRIFL